MNVMVNNYLMVYLQVRKTRANVKALQGGSIKTEEIISKQKNEPGQRSSTSEFNYAKNITEQANSNKDKTDAIEQEIFKLCVAVSMTFVTCWGLMSVLLLWKLIAQGPAPMLLEYLAIYSATLDLFLGPIILGKLRFGCLRLKVQILRGQFHFLLFK
jgi:hypothetical protein